MLRQFLYLDQALVRDFLAQVEGGVFDETREMSKSEQTKGLDGGVSLGPATAKASRGRGIHAESEAVVQQTGPSEFDRLYSHLEADGLRVYDVIDEPLEALGIGRKEIIEVDARLRVSGALAVMDLLRQFTSALPVIQQLGSAEDVDPEVVAQMTAFMSLDNRTRSTSLIGTVAGAASIGLALDLDAAGVRTDTWDVEATVVLKVQRILREGESVLVGDPMGGLLKALPPEQQHQFTEVLQTDELKQFGIGDADVRYPGIIGTPIAIYR